MRTILLGTLAITASCTADLGEPVGADDFSDPVLEIRSPERGHYAPSGRVLVEGVAFDHESGIKSITVNGVEASIDELGYFSAEVPVSGTTLVTTVVTDFGGNEVSDSRSALGGEFAQAGAIPRAIATRISDHTLDVVGDTVAAIIDDTDLGAAIAGSNPVVDSGGGCFGAEVDVNAIQYSNLDVALGAGPDSLAATVVVDNLHVFARTRYKVVCIGGSKNIEMTANRMALEVELSPSASGGKFVVGVNQANIGFDNLNVDLRGLPEGIIELVTGDLERKVQEAMSDAVAEQVGPAVQNALASVATTQSVSLMGRELLIDVIPSAVEATADGLYIEADANVRISGAPHTGYVATPHTGQPAASSAGVQLSIADDTINQALGALWASGALSQSIDVSDNPSLAGIAQTIDIEFPLPPSVNAEGQLNIVVGDVAVTLNGQHGASDVAVTGSIALGARSEGSELSVTVGEADVQAVLADPTLAALAADELEVIRLVALGLIKDDLDRIIGTIPLPSLSGTMIESANASATGGFVSLGAELSRP